MTSPTGQYPTQWTALRFDQVADIATGQVSPTDSQYVDYYHIGPENIVQGTGQLVGLQTARQAGLISGKYVFDEQCIVYSKIRPNLNKVCTPDFTGICSADAYPVKPKPSRVTKEYLFQYMLSTLFVRQSVACSMRTGLPKINRDDLNAIRVIAPPLDEQQKIAAILGTWDAAIEKTGQLIEAKKKLKKALCQQLLTGKKRFKEFVKSTEWSHTRFGRVPREWSYVHISDIAHSVSRKNTTGKELPVLSCTKHAGLVDSLEYFKRKVFSDSVSSYKIVRRRQFAYATNHIEEGSIGYQDLYDEALISPMYTVFTTTGQVDDRFLFRLLKTELYRHIFEVTTSASVNRRGSLRWNEFSRIRVALPGLPEQQRIADMLTSAEREIVALERQCAAFQRQKKGLMQKLLTGEIRVNP